MFAPSTGPLAIPLILFVGPANVDPAGQRDSALALLTPTQRSLVLEAITLNLTYVKSNMFRTKSAEHALFDDPPIQAPHTSWYHAVVNDERIAPAASPSNLLTPAQEKQAFLRFNYARMRARSEVNIFRLQPETRAAQNIALWYGRVRGTRDLITQANLALVLAMATRIRMTGIDFGELVSEGNLALLRAIDNFDVGRGFKFSTYACRAIFKAFSRVILKFRRYRQAFPMPYDPTMEDLDFQESRRAGLQRDAADELQSIIGENRARLSDVEATVIQSRFALNGRHDAGAMTLEEVGRMIGATAERVRQIQIKALKKLRLALESEVSRKQTHVPSEHPVDAPAAEPCEINCDKQVSG